tara:strand:- start:1114 stop:1596 length:483 start_codon:yes stop_codon:yes gene_type:complete
MSEPNLDKWSHVQSGGKVLSFFDYEGVSDALDKNSFSVEEEVSTLVQHMRDPDPKISLRAHNQLRRVLNEVAKSSGLITTQEFTSDQEGNQSVRITRNSKLLSNLKTTTARSKVKENPDYAASYLPATGGSGIGNSSGDEGNGPNGDGEIRGSDPIRLGD